MLLAEVTLDLVPSRVVALLNPSLVFCVVIKLHLAGTLDLFTLVQPVCLQ